MKLTILFLLCWLNMTVGLSVSSARDRLRELLYRNITAKSYDIHDGGNEDTQKCVKIPHIKGDHVSTCCLTDRVDEATGRLGVSCFPAVIIAGFQKAGTTALASMLAESLDLHYPAQKETHFFDKRKGASKKELGGYVKRFPDWEYTLNDWHDPPLYAEATPFYVSSPHACARMAAVIPEVKVIVLIREPVSRAYSEWQMKRRRVEAQDEFSRKYEMHKEMMYYCMSKHAYRTTEVKKCVPATIREDIHFVRFLRAFTDIRAQSGKDWFVALDMCFGRPSNKTQADHEVTPEEGVSHDPLIDFTDDLLDLGGHEEAVLREAVLTAYGQADEQEGTTRMTAEPDTASPSTAVLRKSQKLSDYESSFRQSSADRKARDEDKQYDLKSARATESSTETCLARATPERLTPFKESMIAEMAELKRCTGLWTDRDAGAGRGRAPRMSVRRFRAGIEECVRVVPGISGQYAYRSLYVAQLRRCADHVPQEQTLVMVSERMDANLSQALHNASDFIGVAVSSHRMTGNSGTKAGSNDSTGGALVVDDATVMRSVEKHFPRFENQTGWRLRSEYDPLNPLVQTELREFFEMPNQLLAEHLGDASMLHEWKTFSKKVEERIW